MPRIRAPRILQAPALLAAFLCAAGFVLQRNMAVLSAQEETSPDLECSSYCSNVRPGTSLIEVRMRVSLQALAAADLRTRVRQQQLEVTVYSEGFQRGLFSILQTLQPKTTFRAAPRAADAAGPPPRLPTSLTRLIVTDVATRQDPPAREPLRLMQAMPAGSEWAVVRIEGVDPGTDYIYRVPGSPATVTCRAAVCPVDSIQAVPPKPAPPKPPAPVK